MSLNNVVVVLDLDDTLYKERDYVRSAFFEIALTISKNCAYAPEKVYELMLARFNNGQEVFKHLLNTFSTDMSLTDLLNIYRAHKPNISLEKETLNTLQNLKVKAFKIGLITDGRSFQQRNKLKALGLQDFFDDVIISEAFGSEKPSEKNFAYFEKKYPNAGYWYIGDNTAKDFVTPNHLNWSTICLLDNGQNIHPQHFSLPVQYLPKYKIRKFYECQEIIFPAS